MPIEEIEQILSKYATEERKIDTLLKKSQNDFKVKQTTSIVMQPTIHLSLEEVQDRNKNILRDLETVKGNFRSKAIFSPSEMQWEEICKRYRAEPALSVTTWKCHKAVFV